MNPGPGIGAAIVKGGRKVGAKIAGAQGGYMDVAKTAISGQQKAEAQERNYQHAKGILKKVHKRAGEGSTVRAQIRSGEHDINVEYGRGPGGSKGKKKKSSDAVAPTNPTRDTQGFRQDQPDHVGNGKEMARRGGFGDHPNVFTMDNGSAVREPMKAITTGKNAITAAREAGSMNRRSPSSAASRGSNTGNAYGGRAANRASMRARNQKSITSGPSAIDRANAKFDTAINRLKNDKS